MNVLNWSIFVLLLTSANVGFSQCPLNAGPDLERCVNTPAVTLPTGGTWSGAPASMLNGNVFTPNTIGTYTLTLSNSACSDTDVMVFNVLPRPTVNAGLDATICPGSCHQLNAVASSTNGPIVLYTWSGGAVSNSLSASPTACPTGSGATYSVTVVDNKQCNAQDQITVTIQSPVSVNAGQDLTVCAGSASFQLTGASPSGGTWSGSGVTPSGLYTPGGVGNNTLTYTFITSAGCSYSDTRVIQVVSSSPVDGGANVSSCVGSPAFNLNPITLGGTWSGSAYVTPAGVFNPAVVGAYSLTYSVNDGTCTSTDQVNVNVFALPTVSAGPDLILCQGNNVVINGNASGGLAPYNITWSNASTLSSANSLVTTANPTITTSYTLTVTDARGCQASDATNVTVHAVPVVNAGPDISLCAQSPATTLTGQTPVGGSWSGTCVSSTGVFSPCGEGTYTLTYTVSNASGCSASDTRVVQVTAADVINAGVDLTICRNEGVILLSGFTTDIGTWSGSGIVNATNGLFNPVISGAGTHTITLTAGTGNCQVTDQMIVTVNAEPNVTAGLNQSACFDAAPIALLGASPAGGEWEGPGMDDDDNEFHPSDAGIGIHVLSYRYTEINSGCADTAYKNVEVYSLPTAAFSVPESTCNGQAIIPINGSTGASQYSWNFGQGNTVNGFAPSYAYNTSGTFTIALTAINSHGCTNTTSLPIEVMAAPAVQLFADVVTGCAPLEVNFTSSVEGDDLSYSWNYANGTMSNGSSPVAQTYIEDVSETSYTPSVTVSNVCGNATASVTLTVLPRPVAAFDPTILSTICSPVTVDFNNNSLGMESCHWDFGDGGATNDVNPSTRVYTVQNSNPQTFVISLTVENQCGLDTYQEELTIQPNLVHAAMNISAASGCAPFGVEVNNSGVGGTMIQYEFLENTISMGPTAELVFDVPGDYTIYQYATDGCGFDTTFTTINVLESPVVNFTTSVNEICQGESISFNSSSTNAASLQWEFGDGMHAFSPSIDHLFAEAGEYFVQLTGTANNGCIDVQEYPITVHAMPVALYNSSLTESCAPFELCPDNLSSGGSIYHWHFGDGNTISAEEPCYVFENSSNGILYRNVVLTASNAFGCSSTFEQVYTIYPLPSTNFTLPVSSTCDYPFQLQPVGVSQTFANYEWSISQEVISTSSNPNFVFDSPGEYHISLAAENEYGCSGQSSQEFSIYEGAVAAFTSSATSGCLDLNVNFYNASENAVSYFWEFGDGSISTLAAPQHLYDEQGVFDVKLIVYSQQGCTDTLYQYNYIETYELPVADFSADKMETSIFDPSFSFIEESEDGIVYHWSFGDGNESSLANPIHEYGFPGEWRVTLEVENLFGCKDAITKTVFVSNDFQVYVPNSFTPNNDGLNDVFKPEMEGKEFIVKYKFQVYDRWGTVIFETEDPDSAWIGNTRGNDEYTVNETFKYRLMVEIEQSAETKVFEGLVTVVR